MKKNTRARRKSHPDYVVVICIALLTVFGLLMITSASSHLGKAKFDDVYYYLKHQMLYGLLPGIAGFLTGLKVYYRSYERLSLFILLGSIILLALVFTPFGVTTKGATRWLTFGPITFQPSEIVKLTFIVYLAAWLGKRGERQKDFWRGFLPFLLVTGAIAFLLFKQPTTSTTAIVVGTALSLYFVSGAKFSYILSFFAACVIIFLIIIYFTPYRFDRIANFLNPESDLERGGFHINQALLAIGSGGLTGVGFGQSTTKLRYLPEPVGDSIFAVIGEEFGFIGAIALIGVFAVLVGKIFLAARRHPDPFGRLMLIGFGTVIGLQTFIHIAAISGLIPLTGTPLPFVSYGGTALAVFLTMGGIIVNISKYS